MLDFQIDAVNKVRKYAQLRHSEYMAYLDQICGPFHVDIRLLIKQVLSKPITLNFHPDRLSNNGKTIIENLLKQGQYYGQFRTGTTNGEKSAMIGGNRYVWEQRIFLILILPNL